MLRAGLTSWDGSPSTSRSRCRRRLPGAGRWWSTSTGSATASTGTSTRPPRRTRTTPSTGRSADTPCSPTPRGGCRGSCGTPESRAANPGPCARGYLHLADVRYEVRDTQGLIGRLVDEGVAHPRKIGVTGDSYGGGQSFMLAALSDRMMLTDGRLVPWRSPRGRPLRLAAAAPVIPWTDLLWRSPRTAGGSPTRSRPGRRAAIRSASSRSPSPTGILLAAQFAIGPGQPVGEPLVIGPPDGLPGTFRDPTGGRRPGWVARADAGEPYDDAECAPESSRCSSASTPPTKHISATVRHPLFMGSGYADGSSSPWTRRSGS